MSLSRLKNLTIRVIYYIKRDGLLKFSKSVYRYIFARHPSYKKWIKKNEILNEQEVKKDIETFKYKPKISIITQVYTVDPKWLDKCIDSVTRQYYDNWELCLYDDASKSR